MTLPQSLKSDVSHFINMIQGGWDGAIAVRTTGVPAFTPAWTDAVWAPAAIGAAVGAWSTSWNSRRRSPYSVALGALVGSALGFGCGMAWASRGFTGAVARSAIGRVNDIRDARWLEKNPINYA